MSKKGVVPPWICTRISLASMSLIIMISQVYIYVQTHQILDVKYVQDYTLIKPLKAVAAPRHLLQLTLSRG